MRHLLPFHCSASTTPAPEALTYVPTAMHELEAGQDTQNSWPVGITGFGLGVTDQPRAEAPAGTEARAGIPAAAAGTTARRTDIFAARLILPTRERRRPRVGQTADTVRAWPAASAAGAVTAGRLVLNFIVTPMLRRSSLDPGAIPGE